MNIDKKEVGGDLSKIKKKAYILGEKVVIVSRPEKARFFLSKIKRKILHTRKTYKKLIRQVKHFKHLTHEVENLFDNYYIVNNAISDVLNVSIDKGFKKLVQVEKTQGVFIPRIYSILSDLLKATKYEIDSEILHCFLQAYQVKTPLSIRELCFVQYFLRIILIENVGVIMHESIISLNEFKDAEYWFKQIVKKKKKNTDKDYLRITSGLTVRYGVIPVNLSFNLLQKLSQYGPDTRPIVKWLKLNLLKQGVNISDLAKIEDKRQSAISNQILNTINSLRWINQARWDDFVVDSNIVDSFLTKDPAGVYATLDSATQSFYRNEVVKIGDRAGVQEAEVAKLAIRLCHPIESNINIKDNKENHVGYYLAGEGRNEFEKKIGYQKPVFEKIQSVILKNGTLAYLGSIFLINIILTVLFVFIFSSILSLTVSSILLVVLAFILNCDIAINFTNIFISSIIPVKALFRLDLSSGLLLQQSTFVVIPSMFRDHKSLKELLRRLEVNYLANSSDHIYFALLMGFKNSKIEVEISDQALVDQVYLGIDELNKKYPAPIKKFYIFHRKRIWNPHEGFFMEWERKRGKIREFNLLLRGKTDTSFFEALPKNLPYIKYVLTIDEDTRLPRDSAIKLIGCIDHPLNRPVIDESTNKVISGYGIIQPRMTTKFGLARATAFSRLFSSAIGIDSYTGPAADVYQDLFSNSIFFGKGIYDVDTMEMTIGDRIPENQVLSHDLLEGLYTRVGFATDIFLFEGFPASYKEFILRMHRWIRGDWQIIGWLKNGGTKDNKFTLNDKWKIFDNLRRSTLPIFIVIFLFVTIISYFSFYNRFLFYVLVVTGSSFIISYLFRLFEWPKEMTLFTKLNTVLDSLDSLFIQIAYRFIFLLDQAVISLRAIFVSVYRMLISHKYMLQWQNSHEVSESLKGTVREFIFIMLPTMVISFVSMILFSRREGFFLYLTLFLWFISPLIAYQISKKEKVFKYRERDVKFLRKIACRSTRFFLELYQQEGNHLIPDHYQEEPITNSPAATSPTNIGMHLLSNLSAFDFGYISFSNFLERTLELSLTLDSLEKYKGHFYNWYDIHTLQSLDPKYVSSVDSANLLVNILTLKQGILDVMAKPILGLHSLQGVEDVLNVLAEDANLIIKERTILKKEKKLARQIYKEVNIVLDKYLKNKELDSIEYYFKTFNYLLDSNEKIKKIVNNLNLGVSKGVLTSIYSSTEHFNSILRQQIEEVNIFMSFNQSCRSKPIIRNEKKNSSLAKVLNELSKILDTVPSLNYLNKSFRKSIENLNFISFIHLAELDSREKENIESWYQQIIDNVVLIENRVFKNIKEFEYIVLLLEKLFIETDFSFLYNDERGLFHIGYNVTYDKIDNSYYDFLASEANSISFVSILKKDVPIKHWFYLGRKLVRLDRKSVLLSSWGGSLFEYLTSLIFFNVHKDSLLGHTANLAIKAHIKYGQKHLVPWGMGESAHSTLDLNNNYQYQIFGHPALGFRRDLKDFLVVAPYTVIMSLSYWPRKAIINLRRLIRLKFIGRYGFYDAIDYTGSLKDLIVNRTGLPAQIYYAHHQGFSLQALNNQINQGRLHSLFVKDPRVESLDTLFEEKIPSSIPTQPVKNLNRVPTEYLTTGTDDVEVKKFVPVFTSYPRRAFISNGSYTLNISNVGSGGSKVQDISLTRFREDTVTEPWGQFIYLFDTEKNNLWSPTTQPIGVYLGKNKIEYFENKAKFNKIYNDIESSLTIAIASDSNVEFRSLTLTNHGKDKKNIKIASYGEVLLSKSNEDLHHTTFEKLFVKSEYLQKHKALVYSRPNKDDRGQDLYFAHKIVTVKTDKSEVFYTTNRNEFISRGGTFRLPDLFLPHSEKIKSVLGYNFDQIFCLQNQVELKPNETVTITYVNIFDYTKDGLIKNLKKYSNLNNINHAIIKSDNHSREVINSLGMTREQALNYQALASRLLSPHYSHEIKKLALVTQEAVVQTLWRLGISGDLPILLVRFYDMNDLAVVKNMLLCHKYLKYKGVSHDLVLLNEYPASYIKSFEDEVDFLVRYNQPVPSRAVRGGVFHLRTSHMAEFDRENLMILSKLIIDSHEGTIEQQIQSILQSNIRPTVSYLKPIMKISTSDKDISPKLDKLKFYNGYGGFAEAGKEYIMNINYSKSLYTPTPWVNIISNQDIGFVVTESGSMYTWFIDSYDNRLTQRIDDPLIDRSSEIFYLRDEETGEYWNPTPLPVKNSHTYTVKHGFGYTEFRHKSRDLEQRMLAYVPKFDNIKIIEFKFTNTSRRKRKLSLSSFFEMSVGGANREDNKDYLETTRDKETGAIIVRNIFRESFKGTLTFIDLNGGQNLVTNDREEFLGKNGQVSNPVVMHHDKLSNNIYDDVDHCVALQSFFELEAGGEKEITILLGGGYSMAEVQKLVRKYRNTSQSEVSLLEVANNWSDYLNQIQIKTPDESINTLFNSRLLYQLISSRLLARAGYYQPSGAYGFRDQLQDSMALVWTSPEITRKIILKASRHQFFEGDVQNWWHEHNSFGVRTTFSDQQLWLPYVVGYYLEITGDNKILEEKESYMKGVLLDFVNNSNWAGVPEISNEKYDLYDHCLRAIDKTFVFGKNGLPIIGKGDWNDGLNKVGEKGLGESVWLGWFLYYVVIKFIPYIKKRGDDERVQRYEVTIQNLKNSLEHNAWDGRWYKRAFFDNGYPLGSRVCKEFKIDSISQSWSVLSGAGRSDRIKQAMNSVSKNLFQNDLLLLISPAVKNSRIDPGYIRDYPAGVRENGAQYNHAALWAAQAYAKLNDSVSLMKILDSVNPIKRSADRTKVVEYRVEPYAVASEIYAKPAPAGRGGWTWYTGSAGVMYRTILESLLGFKLSADKLEINPCIPKEWKDFSITYIYKKTKYNIHVVNNLGLSGHPIKTIKVDGIMLSGYVINLIADEKKHEVEIHL